MDEKVAGVNPAELGRHLMRVRERSGIKQSDLAKQITMSQTVLSRIESGDRAVSMEEVQNILEALGTAEAAKLSEALGRSWSVLPRPPLDHPDQDLLWAAEKVGSQLIELRDRPETRYAFERRLSQYILELQRAAAFLLKRDHQVAFIGSIGVGKSTAICHMTGLEVPKEDGVRVPVLEVGGGGITICEVHLREGPDFGLIIEPRNDDEIRADVSDFADHILRGSVAEDDEANSGESQGISKEIERAVRNMSGLRRQRRRGTDGKRTVLDEAKDLAQQVSGQRDFVLEVLTRMELHRRDRRDIWYDSNCGKSPLAWLQEIFAQVNNGRHPEFTLPRRIEVVVPDQLLSASDLSVRLIDTKGIDRTAARADIETHFDDPHTLAVLCSGFNNAPAAEAQLLLERAKDIGVRILEQNSALLVLPRHGEALAMKDESGTPIETVQEGYELKHDQVEMALEPLGLQRLAIGFYDAHQDRPSELQSFITACLSKIRDGFRRQVDEVTRNATTLLENHEQAQVMAVLRDAGDALRSWAEQRSKVPPVQAHVHESLIAQIQTAYASTVRAAIRREGEWRELSYSHHIGYGSRRLAVLALDRTVDGFSEYCSLLAANPRYAEARELLEQADRVMKAAYEELLRKVQLMGQTSFKDALKLDSEFWRACDAEWGQGKGYKNRVTNHNRDWFEEATRVAIENDVKELIGREWQRVVKSVLDLLEATA